MFSGGCTGSETALSVHVISLHPWNGVMSFMTNLRYHALVFDFFSIFWCLLSENWPIHGRSWRILRTVWEILQTWQGCIPWAYPYFGKNGVISFMSPCSTYGIRVGQKVRTGACFFRHRQMNPIFFHELIWPIQGKMPSSIGNLSDSLEWLWLRENHISGPIPPEIGNLKSLRRLYMDYNLITGNIPPTISNLQSLVHLSFAHNKLSGQILDTIGNLVMYKNQNHMDNVSVVCTKYFSDKSTNSL